ncbi:MAG: hypothetical protein H6Q72_4321 [Firmicutes bacterium]|nr:hypothetical protein [Bacillota bacterium]
MGTVLAINISPTKGTEKTSVAKAQVIEGWGLENDGHGGNWDRQVSIFPVEAMEKVPPEKYEEVTSGGYTENITVSGLALEDFTVHSVVKIGKEVLLQVKHIGKDEFKEFGRPYIVSREGRFCIVLKGGSIQIGDNIQLVK